MDEQTYQSFKETLEAMQNLYALLIEPKDAQPIDREQTLRAAARHMRRLGYIITNGTRGVESQG